MKITFSDINGFLNLSPSLSKESVYILKLCSRCTMKLNLQIIKFIELLVVSKISSFTGNPVRRCLLECTSSYGNELYIYIYYIYMDTHFYGTVQMYLHKGMESLTQTQIF